MINKILTIFILIPILMRKTMEQQTGRFINLFDFCQPITDAYCAQLTNESTCILYHSIYKPSILNFHELAPLSFNPI